MLYDTPPLTLVLLFVSSFGPINFVAASLAEAMDCVHYVAELRVVSEEGDLRIPRLPLKSVGSLENSRGGKALREPAPQQVEQIWMDSGIVHQPRL